MDTILFVCTGNTCRSSMAEGIFKMLIAEEDDLKNINVISAGTGVYLSGPASENAVVAVREMGADISFHKSSPLTVEMINNADLILAMTMSHKLRVLNMVPEAKDKTFTLKEFIMDESMYSLDIEDPFGLSLEEYKRCANEIYSELLKAKEKIKQLQG